MNKLIISICAAAAMAVSVTAANCWFLRYWVTSKRTDAYEIFVWSIYRSDPLILITTFITVFSSVGLTTSKSRFQALTFAIGLAGLTASLIWNMLAMPRSRF